MNILKFEIVDHGTEHSDYFQGCGVAFTEYDECYTGIGADLGEALEDAIEQAITSGAVFTAEQTSEIQAIIDATPKAQTELTHTECDDSECFAEGVYYHASIRVKVAK